MLGTPKDDKQTEESPLNSKEDRNEFSAKSPPAVGDLPREGDRDLRIAFKVVEIDFSVSASEDVPAAAAVGEDGIVSVDDPSSNEFVLCILALNASLISSFSSFVGNLRSQQTHTIQLSCLP